MDTTWCFAPPWTFKCTGRCPEKLWSALFCSWDLSCETVSFTENSSTLVSSWGPGSSWFSSSWPSSHRESTFVWGTSFMQAQAIHHTDIRSRLWQTTITWSENILARIKRHKQPPPSLTPGIKYKKYKWRESECEGPGVPSQIEPLLVARHCQQRKGALAQNKHVHKTLDNQNKPIRSEYSAEDYACQIMKLSWKMSHNEKIGSEELLAHQRTMYIFTSTLCIYSHLSKWESDPAKGQDLVVPLEAFPPHFWQLSDVCNTRRPSLWFVCETCNTCSQLRFVFVLVEKVKCMFGEDHLSQMCYKNTAACVGVWVPRLAQICIFVLVHICAWSTATHTDGHEYTSR